MKRFFFFSAMLGITLAVAQPASAQDATGPCTASAGLSNGVTVNPYDPSLEGIVYDIPISGTADYEGSVSGASPPRPISGKVAVSGPPGFGSITIDDRWVWSDEDATGTSDSGQVSWDLPSSLPRGVELEVSGEHSERGVVTCQGTILIALEGGFFDSPMGYVAVGGTLFSLAGLLAAMVARG